MQDVWKNMLLVAGSTQNVGKTTFICELLEANKTQHPIAIKISPHFHQATPGLKLISETIHYQLFEETNREIHKDSSRYLQHGANRSFYMQVKDEHLADAFMALFPILEADKPIVIESAALHQHIRSGLFLFIYQEESADKPSTKANFKIADFVVCSTGSTFSHPPSTFKFDQSWKINP